MHITGILAAIEFIRKQLPRKMLSAKGLIKFAEEVEKLFIYLIDPATPLIHKAIIASALIYFIWTLDIIPDFIFPVGFLDDAGVIAGAVAAVWKTAKP